MATITIASTVVPSYHEVGTLHELRIFCDRSFIAADGTVVPGRGDNDVYYVSYTLTVSTVNFTATVPVVTLMSTQDALNNDGKFARYQAQVFVDGSPRDVFMPNGLGSFWVPSTPTSTSWGALETVNAMRRDIPASPHPTLEQVQNLLNQQTQGIYTETPAGVINGVNGTFTLSHTPLAGSVLLFLNGNLQPEGSLGAGTESYTISGATITHLLPPQTGDRLLAAYRTVSGLVGTGIIPSQVQESSGPTVLSLGAIADNTLLQRSGSTIIGSIATRRVPSCIYNVKAYGAIGNGVADDRIPIQNAINAAKTDGAGFVEFGPGTYNVGAALSLLEIKGVGFIGAGTDNTKIVSTGAFPAVQCNGIWRSKFEGLYFQAGAANAGKAVFELDGNYDGSHTQGVQGNNFTDCYFDAANLAGYAFAICRQGSSSGQGSENIFINTGFISGDQLVLIRGGNALNNLFLGGNFQAFNTGILAENGTFSLYRVAFQSTRGYAQIAAGGADIDASFGSVGGYIINDASDSESLVHFKGGSGVPMMIRGLSQRFGAATTWSAFGNYATGASLIKTSVSVGPKLYRVTTSGTAGAVEPVWPNTGTIADGSVVWTETEYDNIVGNGRIDWQTCTFGPPTVPGHIRIAAMTDLNVINVAANYSVLSQASGGEQIILVDATSGNKTITLPIWNPFPTGIPTGQRVTVKKVDASANTVTVVQEDAGNPDNVVTVIPGGGVGFCTAVFDLGSSRWWITSKSFNFQSPGVIGNTTPGAASFTTLSVTQRKAYPPTSPAQITSNQNNYNPGGNSTYQRWISDASRDVTGLTFTTAQTDGETHTIINIGLADIVLKHQNAGSAAANRFYCSTAADITLTPKQSAEVWYDATNLYWLAYKKN